MGENVINLIVTFGLRNGGAYKSPAEFLQASRSCVGVPNPVHISPPPPVPAEYTVLSVLQVKDAALVVKLIFIFF